MILGKILGRNSFFSNLKINYMTHYYEKNIVDIKDEYSAHLIGILVPLIYEGMKSIYNKSVEYHKKIESIAKYKTKKMDIVNIFQTCLKDIPTLGNSAIESETKRIKEMSRCSEYFDDLIKAVIKSYIVLLTYNASGKTCKLVNDKYHERININEFIHKCYIECSHTFYNNPDIFLYSLDGEIPQKDMKIYKLSSYKMIKEAIVEAIRKMLPTKAILQEYLANDYIVGGQNTKKISSQLKEFVGKDYVKYHSDEPIVHAESTQLQQDHINISKENGTGEPKNSFDVIVDDDIDKNTVPIKNTTGKILLSETSEKSDDVGEVFSNGKGDIIKDKDIHENKGPDESIKDVMKVTKTEHSPDEGERKHSIKDNGDKIGNGINIGDTIINEDVIKGKQNEQIKSVSKDFFDQLLDE